MQDLTHKTNERHTSSSKDLAQIRELIAEFQKKVQGFMSKSWMAMDSSENKTESGHNSARGAYGIAQICHKESSKLEGYQEHLKVLSSLVDGTNDFLKSEISKAG